jgi:hypothetical protein
VVTPRMALKRGVIAAILVSLVVTIFLAAVNQRATRSRAQRDATRLEACRLELALAAQRGESGRSVRNLGELTDLGWTIEPDPWGLEYAAVESEDGWKVVSAGPDRILGNGDDLTCDPETLARARRSARHE